MRTVTVETAAPAAGCQAAGGHSTALLFVLVFLFIGQSLRLSGRGLRSRADRRAYSIAVVIAVPGALLSFLLTTS
jgi:IS4 transposase